MPTSDRITWNGTPGEKYTNETSRTKYQLIPSFHNTCGFCYQYAYAVGFVWSLPLHWGCNCEQLAIKPGAQAPHAWIDFRDDLDGRPHSQQVAAIGASNYKLLKGGVIEWKDVVTPSRVRPLREVVAIKNLSVKTLTDAGVRPLIAQAAHAAVNTPQHVFIEQHRAELLANLHKAGVDQKVVVDALSKGLASRVSIGAGPDTYGTGPAWTGGPVVPTGPAADHAARLRAILATMPRPIRDFGPYERPKPEEPPPAGPAPSSATVQGLSIDVEAGSARIVGRPMIQHEIASLAGLPDGNVYVEAQGDSRIKMVARNEQCFAVRILKKVGGQTVLVAQKFEVNAAHQGKGIGADVFGRMVDQATRLGVDRIVALAGRSNGVNGYYTWARFGYDGELRHAVIDVPGSPISKPITDLLPEGLKAAKRVSDLMMTREGREWWKSNGVAMDMEFDLKPGSLSRRVWEAYRQEKTAPSSKPTSAPPTSPPPTGHGHGSHEGARPTVPKPAAPKLATPEWKPIPGGGGKLHVEKLQAWVDEHYTDWEKSWTKEERSAFGVLSGGGHHHINLPLREFEGNLSKITDPHLRAMIESIDKAIDRAERVPHDMVLYRGVREKKFLENIGVTADQIQPGLEIKNQGFGHMSAERAVAEERGRLFEIRVPKGSKGAWISGKVTADNENEFLLNRNTTLRIIEVHPDRIVAEAIQPAMAKVTPSSKPTSAPPTSPPPTGHGHGSHEAAKAELEAIPAEVRPKSLGKMTIDPKARNEEIDNFLEEHPGAKLTEIPITQAMRDKVLGHVDHWIRSGSEQDLAKLRSVLGADKLPPPIVRFYASGTVGVPDGFHRVAAAILRGRTSIEGYAIGTPD